MRLRLVWAVDMTGKKGGGVENNVLKFLTLSFSSPSHI